MDLAQFTFYNMAPVAVGVDKLVIRIGAINQPLKSNRVTLSGIIHRMDAFNVTVSHQNESCHVKCLLPSAPRD